MIATSGRLITGVVAIPPSGPSEVTVIVPPPSSSGFNFCMRAASASLANFGCELPDILVLGVTDHGHGQPCIGLCRHAKVDAPVARHRARVVVEARIEHGEVGQNVRHIADDQERQDRQSGPVGRGCR